MDDRIIKVGIREADAVVFVTRPRQGQEKDEALLEEVPNYVLIGATASTERVFLVINRLDKFKIDRPLERPEFRTFLDRLLKMVFSPRERIDRSGSNRPLYCPMSVKLAILALQAQGNKPGQKPATGGIQDPFSYKQLIEWAGEQGWTNIKAVEPIDHAAAFRASHVPQLITALNTFASERLIESQISDATSKINQIVATLSLGLNQMLKLVTNDRGRDFVREQREKIFKSNQMLAERALREFTCRRLDERNDLRVALEEEGDRITAHIDGLLLQQFPALWQDHYVSVEYVRQARSIPMPKIEELIGEVKLLLWDQLTIFLPQLSDLPAEKYGYALQHEGLREELLRRCFNHQQCQELLDRMAADFEQDSQGRAYMAMRQVGERIALVELLEPANYFAKSEDLDQLLRRELPLTIALDAIADTYHDSPDLAAFNAFSPAVHDNYLPLIRDATVRAILNTYEFEMLATRQRAKRELGRLFGELRERREPVVDAQIMGQISGLDQVEGLERKLALLAELNTRPSAEGVITTSPVRPAAEEPLTA